MIRRRRAYSPPLVVVACLLLAGGCHGGSDDAAAGSAADAVLARDHRGMLADAASDFDGQDADAAAKCSTDADCKTAAVCQVAICKAGFCKAVPAPDGAGSSQALPLVWDLATDFRASPGLQNPSPDAYGHSDVWRYLTHSGDTFARDGQYMLLPTPGAGQCGENALPGFDQWKIFGDTPWVGKNTSGSNLSPLGMFTIPSGATALHPHDTRNVMVGWRSPISGTVSVKLSLQSLHSCSNGVTWNLDKNSSPAHPGALASGTIPGLGAGGITGLGVPVAPGDLLYLVVGPNGSYQCDSIMLTFQIIASSAPSCSDGDACTAGDKCTSGTCTGAVMKCEDGAPCTADSCDKATGACKFTPIPGCAKCANNAMCEDAKPCTGDFCLDGLCQHKVITCNDGNSCTSDVCQEPTGVCSNKPIAGCVSQDCSASSDCVDDNPCTADSCKYGWCQFEWIPGCG